MIQNNFEEKILLKNNIISFQVLLSRTSNWIHTKQYLRKINLNVTFAYSLQQFSSLEEQFLINWITYAYAKQFSMTLNNYSSNQIVFLSDKIKKYFQVLEITQIRNDFSFHFLLVYLIKIFSCFLIDFFEDFEIDNHLESEICIILYHALMGIQVGLKTYQILHKKFISIKKNIQKKKNCNSKVESMTDSHPHYTTQQICSSMKIKKRNKKIFYQRQSIAQKSFETESQNLSLILKQNLHVDPLPPLIKRKLNIKQYQRLHTETNQNNQQRGSKYILANQLSTAIKFYHKQDLLFQLSSKKIKLNKTQHRFHEQIQTCKRKSFDKINQTNYQNKIKESNKINYNQWNQIVTDLKKKVFAIKLKSDEQENKNKNIESKNIKLLNNPNIKPIQSKINIQQIKQNKIDNSHSFSNQNNQIQNKNGNFGRVKTDMSLFKIQNYEKDNQKSFPQMIREKIAKRNCRNLGSSFLKFDKQAFSKICQKRSHYIRQMKMNRTLPDFL